MKKLLLVFTILALQQSTPANAMFKSYFDWIAQKEYDDGMKNALKFRADLSYTNKSLQELHDELDRYYQRKILVKYFAAPVVATAGSIATIWYLLK